MYWDRDWETKVVKVTDPSPNPNGLVSVFNGVPKPRAMDGFPVLFLTVSFNGVILKPSNKLRVVEPSGKFLFFIWLLIFFSSNINSASLSSIPAMYFPRVRVMFPI